MCKLSNMATPESLPRHMECVGPERLIGLPTAVVGAVTQTHACAQAIWVNLTGIATLSSATQKSPTPHQMPPFLCDRTHGPSVGRGDVQTREAAQPNTTLKRNQGRANDFCGSVDAGGGPGSLEKTNMVKTRGFVSGDPVDRWFFTRGPPVDRPWTFRGPLFFYTWTVDFN